jgi:hypothetical protein
VAGGGTYTGTTALYSATAASALDFILGASIAEEMRSGRSSLFILLEIDFPSENRSYSTKGYGSESAGLYKSKLVEVGEVSYSASDRQNSLTALEVEVKISDEDASISKLIGRREPIHGSAARLYIASRKTAKAQWLQYFTGIVGDCEMGEDGAWSIRLRTDDAALLTPIPRLLISENHWVNAPASTVGKPAPSVYGLHDSTGAKLSQTNDGALPALYAGLIPGTTHYASIMSLGYIRGLRAYKNKAIQSGNYTFVQKVVAGIPWTYVDWNSDPTPDVTVTVDAYGYDSAGDGTGTLLLSPVDQLRHAIVNLAYNYPLASGWSGAWLPNTAAPIDTGSFDTLKASLSRRAGGAAYSGGYYFGDPQVTMLDAINSWANGLALKAMWTPLGQLAVGIDDPAIALADAYQDDPWLVEGRQILGRPRVSWQTQELVNSAIVTFGNIVAQGRTLYTMAFDDAISIGNAVAEIEMTWGPRFE